MKSVFIKCICSFVICNLAALTSLASPAGKVQFADLSSSYGAPKVEINLNQALLSMANAFAQGSDTELQTILKKIEEITVRVYDLKKGPATAFKAVDGITAKLRENNWQPFVSVNEDNERVRIFGKTTGGIMDGLVVMVVEDKGDDSEAVFINIVGEIDPNQVSKVTEAIF